MRWWCRRMGENLQHFEIKLEPLEWKKRAESWSVKRSEGIRIEVIKEEDSSWIWMRQLTQKAEFQKEAKLQRFGRSFDRFDLNCVRWLQKKFLWRTKLKSTNQARLFWAYLILFRSKFFSKRIRIMLTRLSFWGLLTGLLLVLGSRHVNNLNEALMSFRKVKKFCPRMKFFFLKEGSFIDSWIGLFSAF
jgi:hypothetical protein